ncbi:hypothetical protein Tco_1486169, partial [Tanacetum coccineum]
MASTRASISKASKRLKINIILPKQLFVNLTQDDTKTPSPPTQENASMDITLTLFPITPLDVQFTSPLPSPPIFGNPIPWNLLE